MRSSWRRISILSNDSRRVVKSYPLDERGRHLTQFKRQKRRSMMALTEALQHENVDAPAIQPFDLASCVERTQVVSYNRVPMPEGGDGGVAPRSIGPLSVSDNRLAYLSIGYLMCPQ
jgi:hypothetical protein